jgi:hypothetical protein
MPASPVSRENEPERLMALLSIRARITAQIAIAIEYYRHGGILPFCAEAVAIHRLIFDVPLLRQGHAVPGRPPLQQNLAALDRNR